jgi:hypothetical protein
MVNHAELSNLAQPGSQPSVWDGIFLGWDPLPHKPPTTVWSTADREGICQKSRLTFAFETTKIITARDQST